MMVDIEAIVENYINNKIYEIDKMIFMNSSNNRLDEYKCKTARRVLNFCNKYKNGDISKDDFLCSLRNYLLVFQTSLFIQEDEFLQNNQYGIKKDSSGKYYAVIDLPDYINANNVEEAFMWHGVRKEDKEKYFLGTNPYIYKLTGFTEFKSIEQKLAVYGAINTPEGYTTLVSLPTGGGKSLITQTMAFQKKGLTIVIVPTVSLAIDQVRTAKLNINHNCDQEIFCYYSGIDENRRKELFDCLRNEKMRLLFISPEALIKNDIFRKLIDEANSKRYLKNIIIDEAHIVIEWGTFFRVDYQCLEPWRNNLLLVNSQLKTVLLSATFEKKTVANLRQMFSDGTHWIEIRCDSLRKEPRFALVESKTFSEKNRKLIELIRKLPRPMIIYVTSPDRAEQIKDYMKIEGMNNVITFTGKTKSKERENIIDAWTENEYDVIVATSAFGVGVDKSDIRTVLHLYVPENPNKYYQELGRGGRDNLPCLSVMCIDTLDDLDAAYNMTDKVMLPEKILGRWQSMLNSTTSPRFKNTISLDTSVKPNYNSEDYAEDASKVDIQWNVYVILMLRRYNLIAILDMIYEAKSQHYMISIEIKNDQLLKCDSETMKIIQDIREKESKKYENDFKVMKSSIMKSDSICWSEMFYSTYEKVSEYCAGCNHHKQIVESEKGKFPLVLPIREPIKEIYPEMAAFFGASKEMIIIADETDYSMYNILVNKGVSVIIVGDGYEPQQLDMLISLEAQSNLNIMGINEFKELKKDYNDYFVSGAIIAVYNSNELETYERFTILKKYTKNNNTRVIHIMDKDIYFPEVDKYASALVDGPKMDSYLVERMG